MAKSIYETLKTLLTETSVPEIKDNKGVILRENFGFVVHSLPADRLPTPEQFENEAELLAWAQEAGVVHQCLQTGIQGRLIDYRAIFKGLKKGDKWSPEYGQKNVDEAEWPVTKRPNVKKSDADVAREYMNSLTKEQRKAFLAGK